MLVWPSHRLGQHSPHVTVHHDRRGAGQQPGCVELHGWRQQLLRGRQRRLLRRRSHFSARRPRCVRVCAPNVASRSPLKSLSLPHSQFFALLDSVTFVNNAALENNAGGVADLVDRSVSTQSQGSGGGAVLFYGMTLLTVVNCSFVGNTACCACACPSARTCCSRNPRSPRGCSITDGNSMAGVGIEDSQGIIQTSTAVASGQGWSCVCALTTLAAHLMMTGPTLRSPSDGGGALLLLETKTFVLQNSTFAGNSAVGNGSGGTFARSACAWSAPHPRPLSESADVLLCGQLAIPRCHTMVEEL